MFNKIFSNTHSTPLEPVAPAARVIDPAIEAARQKDKAEWESKLHATTGDDALLALARTAPHIDVKISAVTALDGEEALKAAEREFRTHDRRVHRVAKQRLEVAIARREARVEADRLIEVAAALATETKIPANRLVELDRAWQAIDAAYPTDAQKNAFNALWNTLSTTTRARGEQQLSFLRWTQDVKHAVAQANATLAAVAGGGQDRSGLGTEISRLGATLAAMPPGEALDKMALAQQEHIAQLQSALDKISRFEAKLNEDTQQQAEVARNAEVEQAKKQLATAQSDAAKESHRALLESVLAFVAGGEEALAAGHLADVSKHIIAIDELLDKARAQVNAALHTRIANLQSEYARLKGWQHWGGGVARDELVLEAEALAKSVGVENAKIVIKVHADAIEKLRARWKELDRLGGATSRALWRRFEEALKIAYQPVVVQHAKLKAAREQNLASRNQLIDALDLTPFDAAAATVEWREIARALDHFQTEWRKLGPIEHTVPNKAREALVARMQASVARLDAPLTEARRVAQLQRDALVTRATALGADAAARPQDKELINKVRTLQNEWQQHAKALPLQRNVESALWNAFKTATDAVFSQRDAAFKTRDAELKTHRNERHGLIDRLTALTADSPATEIRRTLGEVDTAWRKAGEAPRADAAKLEQRFRTAREVAQKHLAGSAQRQWHLTCDALLAKLLLCEELESAGGVALPAADAEARWQSLGALPAALEPALTTRFKAALGGISGVGGTAIAADDISLLLLQIESALDMPSSPEYAAARRELKLRAMKLAMEGRQPVGGTGENHYGWLSRVLASHPPDATARGRLLAIVAALRAGGAPR